ncbi:MAG: hypothetical protein ACRDPK_11395 [Carbonactinosporaceae bacterium]
MERSRGMKALAPALALAVLAAVPLATAVPGSAAPGRVAAATSDTTVQHTIGDPDRDNVLDRTPGEDHVVREELAPARPDRADRRTPLLYFGQLTDFQLADEESPARVEFVDALGPPLTSAYRPQEGLGPHVVDAMVRQVRAVESPVTGRTLDLVMTTGDNADSTQCNETRWVIGLLDGRATRDATAAGPTGPVRHCAPQDLIGDGPQIDPDSGLEGTCEPADGTAYDGVRGGGTYYEPDESPGAAAGQDVVDGPGYSPNASENTREAGRSNAVRDYPGLFEEMNRPFDATGLGVPWYAVFGNHDGLVQGNQPRNPAFDAVAQGCVKVTALPPAAEATARALLAGGLTAAERDQLLQTLHSAMVDVASHPAQFPGLVDDVPRDPRRHLLTKPEYIAQHFLTAGAPAGHGFGAHNLETGQGNYAFSPAEGVRLVALDSVAENGGDGGNVDDEQFRWLHGQLSRAEERREVVVVFAHHTLRTMDQPPVSPFPPGDQGGNASTAVHFGLGPPETAGEPAACQLEGASAAPTPDETLRCLFLRHPGVVAYVAGHEHENRVVPYEGGAPARHGFWEITTAAHIDWPQQSRVIDLVDNHDGTLSLVATLVDHGAPPRPGGPGSAELASIARELAYNDPDAHNGEDAQPDARGGRGDRNVELLVQDPYG